MSMFMQALFEGIINGSTLALVAMGIALVWGVMGILSFTQGEFLMIAMFCSFILICISDLTQSYPFLFVWQSCLALALSCIS